MALRYLALGDSYTIGESVAPTERWPVQLAALLRKRGIPLAEPEIIATTGWTTDELAAAIAANQPHGPYHLVSLLIGVNNQYRGRPLDEYREQFTALLNTALGFVGGEPSRVLVLSIPDWGVTPFAADRDRARIAEEIDRFNAANREITTAMAAHYCDITDISRRAADDPTLTATDGLHPSAHLYREWANLAVENIAPTLLD